jgi:hypothetical protein
MLVVVAKPVGSNYISLFAGMLSTCGLGILSFAEHILLKGMGSIKPRPMNMEAKVHLFLVFCRF